MSEKPPISDGIAAPRKSAVQCQFEKFRSFYISWSRRATGMGCGRVEFEMLSPAVFVALGSPYIAHRAAAEISQTTLSALR